MLKVVPSYYDDSEMCNLKAVLKNFMNVKEVISTLKAVISIPEGGDQHRRR